MTKFNLQQEFSMGIMGVLSAVGFILMIIAYLFLYITKRKKFFRAETICRRIVLPVQYWLSICCILSAIIMGSSLGLYSTWISFILSSLLSCFGWIHFHRKDDIGCLKKSNSEYFYHNNYNYNLVEENEPLMISYIDNPYNINGKTELGEKSNYFKNLWRGFRNRPIIVTLGSIIAILICGTFCLTSDRLCIAVRPTSLSTRFTRYLEGDSCQHDSICHVYFTLSEDPSTSIIVNFHTRDLPKDAFVKYRLINSTVIMNAKANWFKMEDLTEVDRYIYWAEVTGLEPGKAYAFTPGYNKLDGTSVVTLDEHKIRTVPGNGNVTFVTGGDMENDASGFEISRVAASQDPYFAILGGDIAYADGNINCYKRWDFWFENWSLYMRTPAGFDIPFSVALGNHEAGGDKGERSTIPFFLHYFPQTLGLENVTARERPLYHAHKIANHTVALVLDSGIVESMTGDQLKWMEKQLNETKAINKFAIYHYALYPSITRERLISKSDRDAWANLFNKYHLTVGFENHFHVFKRSKTIKDEKVVDSPLDGTTYLGDGAWGIQSHDPFLNLHSWWMETGSKTPHVLVVQASEHFVKVDARNNKNQIFNTFVLDRTK